MRVTEVAPLPTTTQWDLVAAAAPDLAPAVEELARQAAQGTALYNDDTTMRILKFTAEARAEALPPGAKAERTGVFTCGVVAETVNGLIALCKTGPGHAGEHLAEVRDQRRDSATPIQMSDALARNAPRDHPTQAASCIPHGCRKFVEVHDPFPAEVAFVLKTLRPVFHTDQQAQQQGLNPHARLFLHQQESGPRMQALHDWMAKQWETHAVEPNSELGQAIRDMQNHWDKLTLFRRVPRAPLSNNVCERALKKAILHRNNSLFYRTLNGAKVGDLFMSLIHTAELHQVAPFDYLIALQRYPAAVALVPSAWMPWNDTTALARLAAKLTTPPRQRPDHQRWGTGSRASAGRQTSSQFGPGIPVWSWQLARTANSDNVGPSLRQRSGGP